MITRSLACCLLITVALAMPAVEVPLDRLGEQAVATDLGAIELQAWFAKDGFPDLDRSSPLEAKERNQAKPDTKPARSWQTPGGGASLAISEQALEFGSRGRNDYGERFGWLPAVSFTPTTAGTFALTGTLTLRGGGQGDGLIAWSVFRLLRMPGEPPEVAVVLHQRLDRGVTLDLATLPELRAIKVAAGEALLLAVWRPAWHHWGSGRLSGFGIAKVP